MGVGEGLVKVSREDSLQRRHTGLIFNLGSHLRSGLMGRLGRLFSEVYLMMKTMFSVRTGNKGQYSPIEQALMFTHARRKGRGLLIHLEFLGHCSTSSLPSKQDTVKRQASCQGFYLEGTCCAVDSSSWGEGVCKHTGSWTSCLAPLRDCVCEPGQPPPQGQKPWNWGWCSSRLEKKKTQGGGSLCLLNTQNVLSFP